MHGVDQFLTRKRVIPRFVFAAAAAYFGDDHEAVGIGMKRLLDDLIGYMRAVIVAGIDVIHAGCDRLAQNSNRSVNIARRSPNLRTGKLDRAVAHSLQADRSARKCKTA